MSIEERIEPDGERKQVTVLFADVYGSMDLAESQDPERWRKIMQRFFGILADGVHRYEGTVDKFTGDGIMAVFGAPIAHEDHARRACYAALQMLDDIADYATHLRRKLGLNFSTRIGIHSGEVVTGAIGEGIEYTAIGHTVGLAQRMEALAEPGKAYLTAATHELARGYLDLKNLGEFDIKGASQPIRVYELAGIGDSTNRLDLSRKRGLSRFVGRNEEMAVLRQALESAKNGEGGAVGIVAEAGIGKSRVCYEFAEEVRREGIDVYRAQAQPHAKRSTFMPMLRMLRSYFGISDGEPERAVREKVAGRTLLLDPGFADDLPLLFDFLGVADRDVPLPKLSAEARNRAIRKAVCRLVRAPNRRRPMVLIVEDLHWLDAGSDEIVAELLASIEGSQTLLIINSRPEYEPDWTAPSVYREIALQPLRLEDTAELVRDLAGDDPSLKSFAKTVHERTSGNPFFIEEIVRSLTESGHLVGEAGDFRLVRPVGDAGVPATIHTMLAARIDRLKPDAKRLLQAASVAGKEVAESLLPTIAIGDGAESEAALRELIEAGFLYELELYPERILAFRHPLTREIAYGTQLVEQREATHLAVARAMIELNPDRHDELAAAIANHMEEGGDFREAARWDARAAVRAGRSRPGDALRLWHKVTELTDRMDDDEETTGLAVMSRLLQLDYSWRLGMDRGEEARLIAEAEEIATRTGDLRSLALLRVSTTARPGKPHIASDWIAAVEETNRLADEAGDLQLRIAIRAVGSYAYMCAGEFDRFDAELDRVIELCGDDRRGGAGIVIGIPLAWAHFGKGMTERERGRIPEAEALFAEALAIATEEGDPEIASWTRSSQAITMAINGEAEAGLSLARMNCELTERLGDVFSRALSICNLGATQLAAGEFGDAVESLEEAERIYREANENGDEMETWRAALRSEALVGVGRIKEALELATWASETARERGMRWSLTSALKALAMARAAAGEEGVEEALEETARVATETGALATLLEIEKIRDWAETGAARL